uniref:Bax inhibitor 1 n=1 Tax=Branchiostoma floridae TaxID=7739 RepID=C3YF20_BRAFL|eukprot:XP_002605254.1 hypothetical protein BRAFLDRAFT_126592 [Branchiostoma floridae]
MDALFGQRKINLQALTDFSQLEKPVKEHLKKVYSSLAIAMLAAAAGAYVHLMTGFIQGGFLSAIASIGLLIWLGVTENAPANQLKRLGIMGGFAFCVGLGLGPLMDQVIQIDPSIIPTAFIATTVVFVSFTLSALWAQNRYYLFLGGMLMSGLQMLMLGGLLNLFFRSYILFQAQLYVGLAIFCAFVLYDTQLIVEKRRRGDTDYIWHCVDLFLDFVNIFRRIMIILAQRQQPHRALQLVDFWSFEHTRDVSFRQSSRPPTPSSHLGGSSATRRLRTALRDFLSKRIQTVNRLPSLKAGIFLIGTVILTIWCKRRTKNPPLDPTSGPNSNIDLNNLNMTIQGQSRTITDSNTNTTTSVVTSAHDHQYEDIDRHTNLRQGQPQTNTDSNTNTTAAGLMASAHDHQYEDIDNHHDQKGQGQSMANAQPLKVESLSHDEVLAALKPNPMYAGVGAPSMDQTATTMTSGHDQIGHGHSQTITESHANTKAAVVVSGHDHQYKDVENHHDQTEQGRCQAINESLDARNLSYGTGPTASQQNALYKVVGQYQTIIKSNANNTSGESNSNTTVGALTGGNDQYEDMTKHNQTEQGQSQAINELLDARNLSYGTGPTASHQNSLYKVVGQYQTIIKSNSNNTAAESNSNTTAGVVNSGHYQCEDMTQHNQTGQGQSQAITESNPDTTARVLSSCHDQKYEDMNQHNHVGQGQSQTTIQSLNVENLSQNEVLAALKPNPMYAAVGTPSHDQTSTVMTGGHDQAGQGQSQTTIQSLNVENLSLNEVLAALKPNPMYAAVGTPSHDQTSTVMTGGHDQAGQGQSQTTIQSLNVENLSLNEAALKPNPMYAAVETPSHDQTSTVMTGGHDQTGQGQPHLITKFYPNTTATVVSGRDHQYEDMTQQNKTGQSQPQANTQSPKIGNLSHNEVIASLNPNPMYAAVVTIKHGQTNQDQSQTITTESTQNTTPGAVTSGYDQYEDINQQNKMEHRQPHAIIESNTASQLL